MDQSYLPFLYIVSQKMIPNFYVLGFGMEHWVLCNTFELVIEPGIIKLSDSQYCESHFSCCTFNTCRQNTRRGLTQIQIAPCCITNFTKDWNSYWFYVKVDMSKIPGYVGAAFPLSSPIEELTATCTAPYNHHAVGFRNCERAFHLSSKILGGRDIIEEFITANIWPISYGWAPTEILFFNVNWAAQEIPFPRYSIELPEDQSADDFMDEIEKKVNAMIGESTMNEYKAFKNFVKHKKIINRVFSEVCGDKSFCSRCSGIKKRALAVAVASCSFGPPKTSRSSSSKKRKGCDDGTSSATVCPERTKSLESNKRNHKSTEHVSDAELQAATSLAGLSRRRRRKL
jgi:hypothetical protein